MTAVEVTGEQYHEAVIALVQIRGFTNGDGECLCPKHERWIRDRVDIALDALGALEAVKAAEKAR